MLTQRFLVEDKSCPECKGSTIRVYPAPERDWWDRHPGAATLVMLAIVVAIGLLIKIVYTAFMTLFVWME